MIGALKLWSQRRKLRNSLAIDPLAMIDPRPWLDDATSVLQLRTTCPQPGWLVHCAYWAEVKMDTILAAATIAADHMIRVGPKGVFPRETVAGLRQEPLPDLAELVVDIERRHPAIRGIETLLPSQMNLSLASELGERHPASFEPGAVSPDTLVAGGFVLFLVSLFHRHHGLRESLVMTCAGMATLFAVGSPEQREALLAIQREAYGWPLSMTSTTFVK
jgi:hypothetical protein